MFIVEPSKRSSQCYDAIAKDFLDISGRGVLIIGIYDSESVHNKREVACCPTIWPVEETICPLAKTVLPFANTVVPGVIIGAGIELFKLYAIVWWV